MEKGKLCLAEGARASIVRRNFPRSPWQSILAQSHREVISSFLKRGKRRYKEVSTFMGIIFPPLQKGTEVIIEQETEPLPERVETGALSYRLQWKARHHPGLR